MLPAALLKAPAASTRIARAERWLAARDAAEELLVVAATADAAHELVRRVAHARGAAFGWHRTTLPRLAAALAAPGLAAANQVPVGRLATEAVAARSVDECAARQLLGRYAALARGAGFGRALAAVLAELRLAGVEGAALAARAPELGALLEAYQAELERAGLVDRAGVFARALAVAGDPARPHPLLGLPTLLLDVPLQHAAEAALVAAVAARAPALLVTAPAGDARTLGHLERRLGSAHEPAGAAGASSLERLQAHLFEKAAPAEAPLDASVLVLSAPGESRECVEIARRLLGFARTGVRFDRMAILLRSSEEYRPHLEEALGRAGIPAHFARGAVRPDPAGRAFLALLACAAEQLSARRFAEYLSLGEVPDATAQGEPPPAPPVGERWVHPDQELVSEGLAEALEAPRAAFAPDAPLVFGSAADPDATPVTGGQLRAPRHWERLLGEAAVIGGRERWARRLDGLARELALDLAALDDPDGAASDLLRRRLADLASLRGYALPLLDALAALPGSACWGVWLDALSGLAARALRQPERVIAALAELAPMARVGPVALAEVRLVLASRLLELTLPPPRSRYGRVFVAPAGAARGLEFDVVCVPGLAERLFPRKISEEPLLLDAARRALSRELSTNDERVEDERLALRIAVGAARTHLLLSYPRLDLDQSRPRVPSFYALEALRAAEGRLPGFDELAGRAERVAEARVGWPAPARPEQAIDAAEHDLALLEGLLQRDPQTSVGTARYLLAANPHLGRALRFRARRWLPRWTEADGLLPPLRGELAPGARAALRRQRLAERSYSPTALEKYAACPYRFYLHAVLRLAPRELPEAIDELDPLQRGSLVHEVQFAFFRALADEGMLPLSAASLESARARLDAVLDATAERYREDLAPAIDRVWQDGIAGVRADLREWLRRASQDRSGFVPWRFELCFGLRERRARDPASVPEPVALDCGIRLRGSIDLVERSREGSLRVTDHKTGRQRVEPGSVLAGGTALQPLLYALAAEKLFPEAPVESGRLYYCTAAGGFAECDVPLDPRAREGARVLAQAVDAALAEPFLPAAPAPDACRWCDYAAVCGPYEELRTARKWQGHAGIQALRALRALP